MANLKVAVLTHRQEIFAGYGYLLAPLLEAWKMNGYAVVVLRGIEHFEPADILFLHVNLTVIPADYLAFCRRYPLVINGLVEDISKRRISANLLSRGDPYDGPVIVKTDRNYGGRPERFLTNPGTGRRLLYRLQELLPLGWSSALAPDQYPIFPTSGAVPEAVWKNPALVVEKFLPERDGDLYCLRQWIFLGDREKNQRLVAATPIIKAQLALRREDDLPVPAGLRQLRAQLHFDYGKFDYVMIDGDPVLLDANRTPSFRVGDPTPRQLAIINDLAQGLRAFGTDSRSGVPWQPVGAKAAP